MTVGIVGTGPAVSAVEAALADVETDVTTERPGDAGAVELTVAVDDIGGDTLVETGRTAREAGRPWIAVELGGVGGHPVPDVAAAVAGFGHRTGCYDCLRGRVAATLDESGATPDCDVTDERFAGAIAGREAARLLADGPATILGRVVEVPHASRQFLSLPGCECASDRTWELELTHEARDVETAVARIEGALDQRVGLVTEVGEVESFPAPYYLAEVCDTSGFSDARAPSNAAGVAVDWNVALLKALGEALERYSAAVYRTAGLPTGTSETVRNAVAPERFVGAESATAGSGESLSWVPGLDLHRGTSVSLPAATVLFPPPAPRVRPASTTGLGLGSSTVGAVLSGLYETVERDAAMLAWYSTYEPLEVAVEDEGYGTLVRRARSEDLAATALLLTQDVDVPVIGAAVHRADGPWPRFAAGMGADLDPAAAARSALAEALQNWMELRGMGRDGAAGADGAIGHYADFPAPVRGFVDAETTVPAASVGPGDGPDGVAELDRLLERLESVDLDAYAARLTPPDVAALGFDAVRALVPAAQPLFTDEPYFGERAATVPSQLGFEPRLDREHHPFP